jgi:predicted membrane protein (TIGR00267 family)
MSSGGASFIGSLIPLAPWIFSVGSVAASVGLSLISLFALGIYAGYISKQSYAISVVKMVGLGMLIVIAVQLLRIGHLVQ